MQHCLHDKENVLMRLRVTACLVVAKFTAKILQSKQGPINPFWFHYFISLLICSCHAYIIGEFPLTYLDNG